MKLLKINLFKKEKKLNKKAIPKNGMAIIF